MLKTTTVKVVNLRENCEIRLSIILGKIKLVVHNASTNTLTFSCYQELTDDGDFPDWAG